MISKKIILDYLDICAQQMGKQKGGYVIFTGVLSEKHGGRRV